MLAIVPALLVIVAAGLLFTRLGTVFKAAAGRRLDHHHGLSPCRHEPAGGVWPRKSPVEKALLKKFPQITHVFSRIGTAAVATDPMPPNENDLYIHYKPHADWPADGPQDKAALVRAIEAEAQRVHADQRFLFAQPIEMRFNEMLEGTRADLSVKIYGDDNDRWSR